MTADVWGKIVSRYMCTGTGRFVLERHVACYWGMWKELLPTFVASLLQCVCVYVCMCVLVCVCVCV